MLFGFLWFIVLLLVLLAIPVTISFRISQRRSSNSSCTLVWLFGLVRVSTDLSNKVKLRKMKGIGAIRHKSRKHKRRKGKGRFFVLNLIRQQRFRKRLVQFVSQTFAAIKRKDVRLHLRIGFDDPADTGVLWGVIGPVAGWFSSLRNMSVAIVPEFYEDVFEIDGGGELRFVPLQLIYSLSALVLSPVVWKSIARAHAAETIK